jgi:uncharacterized metal-binding protein
MPGGTTHTASAVTFAVAFMLGAVVGYVFGVWMVFLGMMGMVVGELLLSPDLDHDSGAIAYRRWGILKFLWRPYQKLVPHRGVLSHAPLIGTAARLVYLAGLFLAGWWFAGLFNLVGWEGLEGWFTSNWRYVAAVAVGVELSTDLHLSLDLLFRERG